MEIDERRIEILKGTLAVLKRRLREWPEQYHSELLAQVSEIQQELATAKH